MEKYQSLKSSTKLLSQTKLEIRKKNDIQINYMVLVKLYTNEGQSTRWAPGNKRRVMREEKKR